MSPAKLVHSSGSAFRGVFGIIGNGLKAINKDPQILIYPYLAVLIILVTFPLVNSLAYGIWDKATYYTNFSVTDETPQRVRILLGLVTFYVFYTGLITAYFTCAVSASVMEKLEGRPTTPLYGMRLVFKLFFKVTKFALIAIFLFPLGIIAQYKKLSRPKGVIEVLGSSLSLHIAQLAPAILSDNKNIMDTIRYSVNTLGKAWRENLVIKIVIYLMLVGLAFLSFLPKLVEHYWFDGSTSNAVGWAAAALLGVSSYVVVKVIGTVFTTTLYYRVSKQKELGRG